MTQIYLDYSASSPVRKSVLRLMTESLANDYGNPASIHSTGRESLNHIDIARRRIASFLNCLPSEIVFTSGGTESDNLAVIGLAGRFKKAGHIITSAIEHKAILESCALLEKRGWRISYVRPNKNGLISVKDILREIQEDTKLISIMYANNEIGTIQPIREIGKHLQVINKQRPEPIRLHTDAVQAGVLLNMDTKHLHVDLLTLSAHKLGGVKGVGLLYVKDGVLLEPLVVGGGQERGLRSGTLNTAGIVAMSEAISEIETNRAKETSRLQILQKYLISELSKMPDVEINGSLRDRLVSNINFSVRNKKSDDLVIGLDRKGIAVSAASACSSGSINPSYVISAMGLPEWRASSTIRISMGFTTKKSDITKLLRSLKDITK